MKTLQLSDQKARILYKSGSNEIKEVLEESFGKAFFSQDVTERIKTLQDALSETGKVIPQFSDVPESDRAYHLALYKMSVIAEALNEDWKPEWDNHNEYKWRPWFLMSPSGFSFYDSSYDGSYANAGCGSRLCFKSKELATYCAKQFLDIWKDIQLK